MTNRSVSAPFPFDYASKAASHQVESPCVSICTINDDSGLCDGCFRTLDEIAVWSQLDNAAKREVWRRIEQRAAPSTTAGAPSQTP